MPKRLISLLAVLLVAVLARAQGMKAYEYWLDADYAAHQNVSSSSTDITLQLSTEQMGQGVHYFNVRALGEDDEWGPLSRFLFFVPEAMGKAATVKAMEYWIDTDHSSRQTIGLAPGDADVVDISHAIDVSQLAEGVHFLSLRLQDADGVWSAPSRHIFYMPEPMSANATVTLMEYTLDDDASTLQTVTVNSNIISHAIDVSALSEGVHFLTLRLQNSEGTWSTPTRHIFFNPGSDYGVNSPLVGYQYSFNDQSNYVSIPEQLEYVLDGLTFDLPDPLLTESPIGQRCTYTFSATEAKLVRQTPMSFSIAFENKTHNWSNRVGEAFTVTDEVTHPLGSLALKQSATVQKMTAGDFAALTVNSAQSRTYYLHATQPCQMQLYRPDGSLLTTIDMNEPGQNYQVGLDVGTYHAVVFNAVQNEQYAAPDVTVYMQANEQRAATPQITFTNLHVYLSTETPEATIRYTLDGTDPSEAGAVYSQPIAITQNCTVKAVAQRNGYDDSDVAQLYIDVTNLTTAVPQIARQGNQLVVTSLTSGARFHYTFDGTVPTAGSPQTDRIIEPPHNCTVRVVAMKDGELPSAVVDFTVDWFQAETPAFLYDEATSMLTISCGTPGATIYYTTDGSTPSPSPSSTVYTEPLHIDGNLTIKAIAVAEHFNQSETAIYSTNSFTCAQPTIRLEAEKLVMDCTTENATIYYTLDGSSPDTNGTAYSEPIAVSEPCQVRAVAKKKDYNTSAQATFQLLRTAVPVFQPMGNAVLVTSDTQDATIHYTTDNTEPTAQSPVVTADGRIGLAHNLTLKAIALKDQELPSAVADFTVDWFQAETPSFLYDEATSMLTISCGTPGATIYYEIGDDEPSRSSSTYVQPLLLTDNRRVRALAVAEGFNDSEVGEYLPDAFTCDVPVLAFDGRHLTMTCATEGATIRYTLDGSTPGSSATEYTGALVVEELLTVKAVSMKPNTNSSAVATLPVLSYFDGDVAQTATEGVLSQAFGWANTGQVEQLQLQGQLNDADMQWLAQNLTALQHLDMSQAHMAGNALTAKTFSDLGVLTLRVPQSVTKAEDNIFSQCPRLAAIVWSPSFRLTDGMLGGLNNPNLLVYARTRGYAPASLTNVVVDGHADNIVLSDADEGSNANFCCPEAFVADRISYTHHYAQQTGQGECRGWETLCLPFAVQRISHVSGALAAPFAADRAGGERPFWLCRLGAGGFERAATIEANTPYIIAMPNHPSYADEYLLAGDVTFEASNATVAASADLVADARGSMTLVPAFTTMPRQEGMLLLNVSAPFEGYAEGSAFLADVDELSVHPFQAYVYETDAAIRVRYIGDDEATSTLDAVLHSTPGNEYYDLQGRRVKRPANSTRLKPGIYVMQGRKVVVK